MLMFPGKMNSPDYDDAKNKAVKWVQGLTNAEEATVKQAFSDLEAHDGSEGGGGITDLTVSIITGARNEAGNVVTLTAGQSGGPFRIFHHSAGAGAGSANTCTIFWIPQAAQVGGQPIAKIVGIGCHKTETTYKIKWLAGAGFTFGRNAGVTASAPVPTVGATIMPFSSLVQNRQQQQIDNRKAKEAAKASNREMSKKAGGGKRR